MRWFINYVPNVKIKFFFYNFLIILGDIFYIFPPLIIGTLIDSIQTDFEIKRILFLTIAIIIISILNRAVAYLGVNLLNPLGFKITSAMKDDVYKKLNTMDSNYFNNFPVGEINTMLTTDMYNLRRTMTHVIKHFVVIIINFIVAIFICSKMSTFLTILIMLPLPFIYFLMRVHIKETKPMYENRRDKEAETNNYVQENIEANRIIKNLCTEEKEIRNYRRFLTKMKGINLGIENANINFNTKINLLCNIPEIILIFFGGLYIIDGRLSLGNFMIFYSLLGSLIRPFTNVNELLDFFQTFYTSLNKIKTFFQEKTKIKDLGTLTLPKNEIPEIDFLHVGVAFENQIAIRDLNLHVKPGSTVAFIGEVGSGKSTSAKLLLRFCEPSSGTLQINGKNISDFKLDSLRDKIGYVAQSAFLFSDTIRENIAFGNKTLDDEEINYFIHMAKAEFIFDLPEGLDTIIGEKGIILSGGEKQRLCLARALAKQPQILVLDDITSALDIENEIEITKNINDMLVTCTKIIIAQKVFSVKNANQIVVMKNNRVEELGTHEELLIKKGYYYSLYKIQKESIGDENASE